MIRIKSGPSDNPHPLAGHKAVVIWSDKKTVKVPVLIFGSRDVEVTLKVSDVEVIPNEP
jgi:transcription antitermination factor NusG